MSADPAVAVIDEIVTIEPPPAAKSAGSECRIVRNTPSRLTDITSRHWSNDISVSGTVVAIPAFGTTTSSRPHSATARSMSART